MQKLRALSPFFAFTITPESLGVKCPDASTALMVGAPRQLLTVLRPVVLPMPVARELLAGHLVDCPVAGALRIRFALELEDTLPARCELHTGDIRVILPLPYYMAANTVAFTAEPSWAMPDVTARAVAELEATLAELAKRKLKKWHQYYQRFVGRDGTTVNFGMDVLTGALACVWLRTYDTSGEKVFLEELRCAPFRGHIHRGVAKGIHRGAAKGVSKNRELSLEANTDSEIGSSDRQTSTPNMIDSTSLQAMIDELGKSRCKRELPDDYLPYASAGVAIRQVVSIQAIQTGLLDRKSVLWRKGLGLMDDRAKRVEKERCMLRDAEVVTV